MQVVPQCPSSPYCFQNITLGNTLAVLRRMAPYLALSTLELIHDMINSDEPLTTFQMAAAAGCSKRAIKRIHSNLKLFGSVRAPPNNVGWQQSITPPMLDALYDHLLEKPDLYLMRWWSFYWMNSTYVRQNPASARLLP